MDPLVSCLLIPFVAAVLCAACWRFPAAHRVITVAAQVVFLAAALRLFTTVWTSGVLAVQIGNWPAPFGITLAADLFSAIMVVVTALIALAVAVYSLADIDAQREKFGYYIFLNFMLMGVTGAFLTGDIFNMFVWFEVMLISSFVLMTLGGQRAQMEGAIKYVVLNLISSALFLSACGILYAKAGTLNLADLALRVQTVMQPELLGVTAMLFVVAFGLKAGIFPLFFWLPASYHTPPVAVSAVFAGLLTKVGVYALVRVFTLIFTGETAFTHGLLLTLAALTMVTGVLGAVVQYDFRRLLSFHIVSQIGYMVMGLALFTPLALAATVFYLFHHIIVKTNLFLISGIAQRHAGSFDLRAMGGLYKAAPFLAALFFIPAMSLGGIPPLSGFFAKFAVVKAGLLGDSPFPVGAPLVSAIALAVGLLTLYSMTKIWNEAFWKKPSVEPALRLSARDRCLLFGPVAVLAGLTLLLGLLPGFFLEVATRAADQLLRPTAYIAAVMKGGAP
jgi:multicomponent Na+:H+ antiporter subunit D